LIEVAMPEDARHVLPTSNPPDLVMVRGKGSLIYDGKGREYLDFIQGWAVNALGHSPPAIARVLRGTNASARTS
jgi:acetylornithine/N-succinyldiaminopimelate aminotransferase